MFPGTPAPLRWAACLWLLTRFAAGMPQAVAQPVQPAKPQDGESGSGQILADYGKLPRTFEANTGQFDRQVRFASRGRGYSVYFTGSGALLALTNPRGLSTNRRGGAALHPTGASARDGSPSRLRLELEGARPDLRIAGGGRLSGEVNYLNGSDPSRWRTHVPTYAQVRYSGVYPGIDLVFYGNQSRLEYDFVVAPGADPSRIQLHFDGAASVDLSRAGDLIVSVDGREIEFRKPRIYQVRNGRRHAVAGSFTLAAHSAVGFRLGRFDRASPLVIDPVLDYSTYLGGSAFPGDQGNGIAIDANGNAYITGETDSTDFPVTQGAFQTKNASYAGGAAQVFVTKMNPTGTGLVYSTYIGGTGGDWAQAIAVDEAGSAYVAGYSYGKDYPTTQGAYQTSNLGHNVENCFVTKLSADGSSLVYSTYLGGTGAESIYGDEADAIAVDGKGNAYVAGEAYSGDFPLTGNAYQSKNNATLTGSNAFLTELSSDGSALVYSTYLGGSGVDLVGDNAAAVALDGSGNAYIAGYSYSADFPTTAGAFQTKNPGAANGNYNAFVAKFDPASGALVYSTLLGGSGIAEYGDRANGLAVDGHGNAYVAGDTYSDNFPVTRSAFQTHNNAANSGSSNVFISKLNSTGTSLLYSTYIGGIGSYEGPGDVAAGLGLDGYGNAYIAGKSYSPDYPVTAGAYQSGRKSNSDADPIVTVLNSTGTGLLYSTYFGGSGADYAYALAVDGKGSIYITGISYSADFPVSAGAFQAKNAAAPNNGTNAFVARLNVTAQVTPVATATAVTSSKNPATVGAQVTYTATVSARSGTARPTGNVVFSINGKAVETIQLNLGSKATLSGSFSIAGRYTIEASYTGGSQFEASSGQLAEVIDARPAAAPVFTPPPGTYTAAQSVKMSDATAGAAIHYTTNGSAPGASSPKYSGPIRVGMTTTIRAIAIAPGHPNSAIVEAIYVIKPPAPAPKFSPAGGSYKLPITVKISDKATAGLVIHYTVNGTMPTLTSPKYTSAGIKVTKKETIKAIAIATGYSKSAAATAAYSPK